MKILRFTLVLFLVSLFCGTVRAQSIGSARLGVIGGFTSSKADANIFKTSSYSLYHAGLAFQIPIIGSLSIQPAVTYQMKGAKLDAAIADVSTGVKALDTKVGYLEIPVQVQWGPDLLLCRPYLLAEPFIGFALNSKTKTTTAKETDMKKSGLSKMEYGLGVGAGIEIWRLQVSGRYFWNFGSLYDSSGKMNSVGETVRAAFKGGKNFSGFSLSAALFF